MLTSNRSRELHDALRRRCLYHWIDFPAPERAAEILRRSVPAANEPLITSATQFVGRVRGLDLDKAPGMAETIDWVSALSALGAADLARARRAADARRDREDAGRPGHRRRGRWTTWATRMPADGPAAAALLRGVDRAAFAVVAVGAAARSTACRSG